VPVLLLRAGELLKQLDGRPPNLSGGGAPTGTSQREAAAWSEARPDCQLVGNHQGCERKL